MGGWGGRSLITLNPKYYGKRLTATPSTAQRGLLALQNLRYRGPVPVELKGFGVKGVELDKHVEVAWDLGFRDLAGFRF